MVSILLQSIRNSGGAEFEELHEYYREKKNMGQLTSADTYIASFLTPHSKIPTLGFATWTFTIIRGNNVRTLEYGKDWSVQDILEI